MVPAHPGPLPMLTWWRQHMQGVMADGRSIPRAVSPGELKPDDETRAALELRYDFIERRLREELPELGDLTPKLACGLGSAKLMMTDSALFMRMSMARGKAEDELLRLVEKAKRAANRALSMKQSRARLPDDLARAYTSLIRLSRLLGMLQLVGRLLDLQGAIRQLALVFVLAPAVLAAGPPRPTPLQLIPQAKPNAPSCG